MKTCRLLLFTSILLLLFLIGIFLLVPFPLLIFQQLVNSQVYIQREADGQFPTSTHFWANPPATQWFRYRLFNITNPDEVLYGAKPSVVEIGPYAFAETEFKEYITFGDNDNNVAYQNNKTFIYRQDKSCETCKYEDVVTLPNAAYMTMMTIQVQNNFNPTLTLATDLLLFLLGEYPIRTVSVQGVLFEGYSDPLVELQNSNLTKILMSYLNNPIVLPDIQALGYFALYNHTNDGDYLAKTGKDDKNDVGAIQKWCNSSRLLWWNSDETADLTGANDGSFQKPSLGKDETVRNFQSFSCRMFTMKYQGREKAVDGIQTLGFDIIDNEYDSFLHSGYQYENLEKYNYFPNWPCGSHHVYKPNDSCGLVDCNQLENFCSSCCNGSYVNGTYLLPPGIVPLRCFPGLNKTLPFAGFISQPHFYETPSEVTNSFIGIAPDRDLHRAGTFYINPTTGATVDAIFRTQFIIPIHKRDGFTMSLQIGTAFLPTFWLEVSVELQDYAISYFRQSLVIIPNIILGVGIALVVVTATLFSLGAIWTVRNKRKENSINESYSEGMTAWTDE